MARPKGIPFSEEYASSNYAEFSVSRKPDHTIKLRRLLLVLLYIIFAALYCTLFLVIWKMAPLIAILPLLLLILCYFTWKLTKIEYTYIVCQGQFHIYQVNGFNRAKEVLDVKISENGGVFPAGDEEQADTLKACTVTLDYSDGKDTQDLYIGVFSRGEDQIAVYFTAASKLLSSLRYYGGDKVIVTYVSH